MGRGAARRDPRAAPPLDPRHEGLAARPGAERRGPRGLRADGGAPALPLVQLQGGVPARSSCPPARPRARATPREPSAWSERFPTGFGRCTSLRPVLDHDSAFLPTLQGPMAQGPMDPAIRIAHRGPVHHRSRAVADPGRRRMSECPRPVGRSPPRHPAVTRARPIRKSSGRRSSKEETMAVNLLEMMQGSLSPTLAREASRYLGESEIVTKSALGAALPGLLAGLMQQGSTTSTGAAGLYRTLTGPQNRHGVDEHARRNARGRRQERDDAGRDGARLLVRGQDGCRGDRHQLGLRDEGLVGQHLADPGCPRRPFLPEALHRAEQARRRWPGEPAGRTARAPPVRPGRPRRRRAGVREPRRVSVEPDGPSRAGERTWPGSRGRRTTP